MKIDENQSGIDAGAVTELKNTKMAKPIVDGIIQATLWEIL